MAPATELQFERDGAQRFRCALSVSAVAQVLDRLSALPQDAAGVRLDGDHGLGALLSAEGAIGGVATNVLSAPARPIRAVLFDKSEANNWGLAWHQDRTVVVRERVDTPGYGPWSTKAGLTHVAPPFDVLAGMATLRVHLDDVDDTNAPLLIAPGSHRLGRIAEADVPGVVARRGVFTCEAAAGDVWAYATPILHASKVAGRPRRRRVLQIDYAARPLDGALEWRGL